MSCDCDKSDKIGIISITSNECLETGNWHPVDTGNSYFYFKKGEIMPLFKGEQASFVYLGNKKPKED